jgi:hypothetical protein
MRQLMAQQMEYEAARAANQQREAALEQERCQLGTHLVAQPAQGA